MIQSLLYRLIIIGISVWIVIHKTIEIIPAWGYFGIMLAYLIVYWYLKKHEKSIPRLLVDYMLINIVIYNTDVYSSIVFLNCSIWASVDFLKLSIVFKHQTINFKINSSTNIIILLFN